MAVHNLSDNKVNDSNIQNQEAPKSFDRDYTKSFGISADSLSLMPATKGSEYTNEVAMKLKEAFDKSGKTPSVSIDILDKETITALSYSVLVIHLENEGKVQYYTILLEGTGRKTLLAGEVMDQYTAASKIPGSVPLIYTADDAFNQPLRNIIIDILSKRYPGKRFHSVDGLVLQANHPEISAIIPSLAHISYNALIIEAMLDSGDRKDLNIDKVVVNELKGKQLNIDVFMGKSTQLSYVGNPIRSDWNLDLSIKDLNNKIPTLNMENTDRKITSVRGYVDAIPELTQLPSAIPGQLGPAVFRFRPNIVITNTVGVIPSIGYALLGLITATTMAADKNLWMAALRPYEHKNHVGNLNIISKIDEGVGDRLDLTNKKYDMNTVYQTIAKMFTLAPIISMDCESFGPTASYTSIFAAAAQMEDNKTKQEALRQLCETASWLTSERFPVDYYRNAQVFTNDGVMIPLGKWRTKNGEKDIRDIDLAFIAGHIDDPTILDNWALSCLPRANSGIDPYITKVDIISRLDPNVEITGKAVRVTFHKDFIETLIRAARDAGLNAVYKPTIEFIENNNIGVISSFLNQGGISGGSTIGRQAMQNIYSYATPYSNMGMGRW